MPKAWPRLRLETNLLWWALQCKNYSSKLLYQMHANILEIFQAGVFLPRLQIFLCSFSFSSLHLRSFFQKPMYMTFNILYCGHIWKMTSMNVNILLFWLAYFSSFHQCFKINTVTNKMGLSMAKPNFGCP